MNVTFTVGKDGGITIDGTPDGDCYFGTNAVLHLKPSTRYLISGFKTGTANFFIRIRTVSAEIQVLNEYKYFLGDSLEFETEANMSYADLYIVIFPAVGTISNLTFRPMIRLASITDSAYEPYTGGIPSPSPEYPQALESVGDVTVTVAGRNLFPPDAINANHAFTLSAGTYYVKRFFGSSTETNAKAFIEIDNVWTYITSIGQYDNGNIIVSDGSLGWYEDRQKLVLKKSYKLYFSKLTTDERIDIRVDGYATTFEPYKGGTLPISTEYGLPGIPVESGGNYTDSTGKHWICDEVDFEKGVYVQRLYSQRITQASKLDTNASGITRYFTTPDKKCVAVETNDTKGKLLCSHLQVNTPNGQYVSSQSSIIINRSGQIVLAISGVTDMNGYLTSNDVRIVYQMETPLEHHLTGDQLAAFAQLHSNYPNTTVFNDKSAEMEVKYVADTQIYVDNKFKALEAAIAKLI